MGGDRLVRGTHPKRGCGIHREIDHRPKPRAAGTRLAVDPYHLIGDGQRNAAGGGKVTTVIAQ
jgi:hypothetical protein